MHDRAGSWLKVTCEMPPLGLAFSENHDHGRNQHRHVIEF
jgi:hypothetical protein